MNILISSYDVFNNAKFKKLIKEKVKKKMHVVAIASDFLEDEKTDFYLNGVERFY